ncbi:MAG: zinc-dependent alcohol dehydrogenase family protein [Acidimicrobiales bacterium]
MRAYRLTGSADQPLELCHLEDPQPGPGQVLVRVRATSLNYRDLVIAGSSRSGIIPLSDGAGEVMAVGDGVRSVAPGDLVAGTFFADWPAGRITADVHRSALGGAIDGMLAELVVLPEHGVIRAPRGWSAAQTATLPCAALTAWNALVEGATVRAGQTVVLLGTGGVSVFGLQLASMMGARTIITSSSEEKLERMLQLGADATINYQAHTNWSDIVLAETGGSGADVILEVGGAGTLLQSIAATRYGGQIALIGMLSGMAGEMNPRSLVARSVDLRGIYVGSREMFADMVAAIDANGLDPIIDRSFAFEDAAAAYVYLRSQAHIGKVVIEV